MAILGGVISLIGYSAFIEKPQVESTDDMMPIQTFQTNYNSTAFDLNTATYAPTNFTEAAEKTVHAVVHVKNTAVSSGINSISDLFNGSRKYQQVGLNWLVSLQSRRLNGILADGTFAIV